jgi:hypothetical protein
LATSTAFAPSVILERLPTQEEATQIRLVLGIPSVARLCRKPF